MQRPDLHEIKEISKKKFTYEEDQKLRKLVGKYGPKKWKLIASLMKGRTSRQCRERWKYYLSNPPATKEWTPEEDSLLLEKYAEFGTHWSQISLFFKDQTDINLKNHFRKLQRNGFKVQRVQHSSPTITSTNPNTSSDDDPKSKKSRRIIDFPLTLSQLFAIPL